MFVRNDLYDTASAKHGSKIYAIQLTISSLGFGCCSRSSLEFFGERDIIEERPGIVELGVPCSLQIVHRLQHAIQLFISY